MGDGERDAVRLAVLRGMRMESAPAQTMRTMRQLPGNLPKVLLVTTCRWQFAARLGMALADAGCMVEAVCPAEHPITKVRSLAGHYPYRALAPLASLTSAIETSAPELLVPCDDRATLHLHELYARTRSSKLRELIVRSLGAPGSFQTALSRSALLSVAGRLSIATPETATVQTREALHKWLKVHGFPAYLKADGTSGGTGVRMVTCPAEAERAFGELYAPPGLLRACKRTLIDSDPTLLLPCFRRRRPAISVQRHIVGRDANSISYCWKGEVLASIAVEVLQTRNSRGPSTVVRLVENAEMHEAARRIARELQLSGFFGLDFLIEEGSGIGYLIEMNPRATQIAHFACGEGRDPAAAVPAALSGRLVAARPRMTDSDVVALFPQEWQRDGGSVYVRSGYHDVPWDEPELVRLAVNSAPGWRSWLTREYWNERRSGRGSTATLGVATPGMER